MAKEYDRAWKTLRVMKIGGVAFALQQQHALVGSTNNHNGGHAAFEQFPADRHRLVPLLDLIENKEEVVDAVEQQNLSK